MITQEELKCLRDYKKESGEDNIRYKEIIKQKLLNNKKIIYALNNKEFELNNETIDAYFGVSILPYFIISPIQTDVQNYICYEVRFNEVSQNNKIIKYAQVIFNIICDQKNLIDRDTYIVRHDLLAALIRDEFNYSNCFGQQIFCISDEPSVIDDNYCCRTLVFEQKTTNNITIHNKITNNVVRA